MESSLYSRDGFYPTRKAKSDFYTAPELHSAFAEILAAEAVRRFRALASSGVPEPYFLVEMGSGNGLLARQISRALWRQHPDWAGRARLTLVERCEGLLIESICSFAGSGEKVLGFTRLEDLPPCAGVFLSNELVDAFPAHLLEKRQGKIGEVYVGETETLGPLSDSALRAYADEIGPHLPEGGRHAVNLEAARWLGKISEAMTAGSLITIDYGRRFQPGDANEPRAFYRHTVDGKLTENPGSKDLTTSVDFEQLIGEGRKLGLRMASFESLSRFLIDRGVLELLPRSDDPGDLKAYRERNRIKALFHPQGMGEAFKVLIQEKGTRSRQEAERPGHNKEVR